MNNKNKKHSCEKCKYFTDNINSLNKHLKTKKHTDDITRCKYKCEKCNKLYNSPQGLWYHKQKCAEVQKVLKQQDANNEEKMDLMMHMINELKNIIVNNNIPMNTTNNTNNTTNHNTNNNTINVFLDTKCNNAINLGDFLKTIVSSLTIQDFENMKINGGFTEMMTGILSDDLQKQSIYNRPIHHYIKDGEDRTIHIRCDNEWKRETHEQRPLLNKKMLDMDFDLYDQIDKLYGNCDGKNKKMKSQVDDGSLSTLAMNMLNNVVITDEEFV